MAGNGSTAYSFTLTRTGIFTMAAGASRFMMIAQIMDYSATDKHKTVISRGNGPDFEISGTAARWPSTSAITSVAARAGASTFAAGSTLSLYGVIA
jgi:hypothetical protein